MSVKCLAIGDPHFKTKNKRETDLMVSSSLMIAEIMNPDFIIIMGDTLDTHEKIHVVPLTQAIGWIEKISKIAPTYVLIGNHDRPNNSDFLSGYHPFNGLKEKDNIFIVDTTMSAEIKGHKFAFVPYVPNGRFMEALSYTTNLEDIQSYNAIFAHQEFFGAKMGAIISTTGDKWPLTYPFVISGHIHDYCQPQENIVYTGTPLQHAFGDSTHKTISCYIFNSDIKKNTKINTEMNTEQSTEMNTEQGTEMNSVINEMSSLDIQYENISLDKEDDMFMRNYRSKGVKITRKNIFLEKILEYRIDMGLPKKKIYRISPRDILTWTPPTDSLIKVVISGTDSEIKASSKFEVVKQWRKRGIIVVYKTIEIHEGIDNNIKNEKIKNISIYDNRKYISKLYDIVKHDTGMNAWYHKLFSSVQ